MKATFGLYNYMLGDTYADAFNRNATANAVFTWHDLNGDKLYEPGEVNLNLNSSDFRSITAASNQILNPNLKSPNTWETTASWERELAANMGLRVMYVNKLVSGSIVNSTNNLVSINTLRPYGAWSVPITRRDPGPDGILGNADDAGSVTLYDYTAAYRGAAFVNAQTVNATNPDRYNSIEGTLTKRFSSRWTGQVSYFAVKNHRWISSVFTSPNDQFFPLDETWSWAGNVTGSYRMPGDVIDLRIPPDQERRDGPANLYLPPGRPGRRPRDRAERQHHAARRAVRIAEALGAEHSEPARQQGSQARRRAAAQHRRRRLQRVERGDADRGHFVTGPSFGFVSSVIPARIARLGVRVSCSDVSRLIFETSAVDWSRP